jgi:predicted permease
MTNLILLILCFIAGMLLHRFKRMPANTPVVLNSFIIQVSLPALIVLTVHDLKISSDVGLMAPLALLSVGFQLRLGHIAGNGRSLAMGPTFKLVLVPLVLFLLYVPLLGAHGQAIQITLFEAAMPPMITSAILATEHDLDPPLANLMVAVGLIISFVTLSMWRFALRWV